MNCKCKDWEINEPKVMRPFLLNLSAVGKWDGKTFVFCPWCGRMLKPIPQIQCQECGAMTEIDYHSCRVCGEAI